ncbi:MAG: DUF2029 domain-containing protein, partial [Acidobacteriota bacterium]|nr:DUF2029 domain-containing protein [Acidobacteriota bacterium]
MTDWRGILKHQVISTHLPLVLIGGALVALYRGAMDARDTITHFLSFVLAQVVLYFLAIWIIHRARASRSTLVLVIAFAALFRLSILFQPPYLSDDMYRYIWDGRVQEAGINPYRYVPADEQLEFLRDETIYPEINRSDYAHTIYPPLAQFIYLIVTRVSQTVTWMKTALVGFEIVAICALMALLASFGWPRQRVLIYAWHPLIVWEIAGSGHIDAAAIAFISLALLARRHNRDALTGVALACAALVKLYPLVLLPALFRRWRWRMPVAFAATFIIAYLPYLSVGVKGVLGFLPDYTDEEGLQDGDRFFALNSARWLLGETPVPTWIYGGVALTVLALLAARALFRHQREPQDYILNALAIAAAFTTLLSPQYAWYFTWTVPFLCFTAFFAWMPVFYLTTASFILYRLWINDQPNLDIKLGTLLYLPAAIFLVATFMRRRLARGRRGAVIYRETTIANMISQKRNAFEDAALSALIDATTAAAHVT